MKHPELPYYVTQYFKSYLTGIKNASPHTIASYAVTFKLLFVFCEDVKGIKTEKLKLAHMDEELITDFLNWLEKERNSSVTSRNQRLVAIHSFFRYVQKKLPAHMEAIGRILETPYKKAPQTVVSYLTEDEMRILLAQPSGRDLGSYRDKVLLSVLYDTGARVQELVDLKVKNVRLEIPPVVTLHGKGDKTRQVPIMQSTVRLLESYLLSYKGNPGISRGENPLFVNQKKQPLSRWGISHIISKYVKKAQEEGILQISFPVTPHIFRHSKAVHMLHAGINLIYIRDFLGHVDCTTTEIYARADTETKRKAIEASCEDIFPKENLLDWSESNDLMSFLNSLC